MIPSQFNNASIIYSVIFSDYQLTTFCCRRLITAGLSTIADGLPDTKGGLLKRPATVRNEPGRNPFAAGTKADHWCVDPGPKLPQASLKNPDTVLRQFYSFLHLNK